MHNCYVIMGVTGCGKTTVGKLLAEKLQMEFLDADDYHPESNIEKMKSGIPLNDQDRHPWLKRLAREMAARRGGCVLGCSALKEKYRQLLEDGPQKITWIYLEASPELIRQRLAERKGHYMPSSLINSQFEALELPSNAVHVDASLSLDEIVEQIIDVH